MFGVGKQRVDTPGVSDPSPHASPSSGPSCRLDHRTGTPAPALAAKLAALTDVAHPMQAAPSACTDLQAADMNGGAQTKESDAPDVQKMIKATRPYFDLMMHMGTRVHHAYERRNRIQRSAEEAGPTRKDLDDFRKLRDESLRTGKGDVSTSAVYKKLKGTRSPSQFEKLLPPDSPFRQLLDPFTGGIRDVRTGLYAELHWEWERNELVLIFPGTGAADMNTKQWLTNLAQFGGQGGVPAMYSQAATLAREVQTLLGSFSFGGAGSGSLSLVGHSLGGGIANYVGLKHDIPSTCYNAAALGRACLKDLGDVAPEKIAKQTHVHYKGDTISSTKTQRRLAALLSVAWQVGIKLPRHLGVRYDLAPPPGLEVQGFWERHRMDAFFAHYSPDAARLAKIA